MSGSADLSVPATPSDPPRSTVVVITWRGREHITACLDALAAQTRPHRTLVVDNASDDGTAELLARHPSAPEVLRLPRNLGYAGGLAAVLSRVDTPLVAWLNDDAAPEPDWLAAVEDALAARPDAAAASARLLRQDGGTQSLGVRLTADGHGADLAEAPGSGTTGAGSTGNTAEVFGFCGGAALLRTSALAAVGGVPAEFFCYYEDTDTAWRLRLAGWRVLAVPSARVAHQHGASSNPGSPLFHRWNERNRLLMLLRCAPLLVALRELARFAVITALLVPRRLCSTGGRAGAGQVTPPGNFRVGLRLRVLAEVAVRLPAVLAQRRRIGATSRVTRTAVWRAWAGR